MESTSHEVGCRQGRNCRTSSGSIGGSPRDAGAGSQTRTWRQPSKPRVCRGMLIALLTDSCFWRGSEATNLIARHTLRHPLSEEIDHARNNRLGGIPTGICVPRPQTQRRVSQSPASDSCPGRRQAQTGHGCLITVSPHLSPSRPVSCRRPLRLRNVKCRVSCEHRVKCLISLQ